jgi:hypothetical protein
MIDIEQSPKATLVRDYNGMAKKYTHERETSDALLELAIGSSGWRTCSRRIDDGDRLKPFSPKRYRTLVPGVDPLLFDYSWNHFDQTQYMHWSVYHVMTEWILAPDERGFGAMNIGIQEVPAAGGPMHHGLLDMTFVTWDDPRRYCDFPMTFESAMLMRFWNYDRDADAFTLRSEGPVAALLVQWNPLPEGGVECWTTPLTRDPARQLDDVAFIEGDMAEDMPHETEEGHSWGMAVSDLGRRQSFDPAGYVPIWKTSADTARGSDRAFDRFAIDIASAKELADMSADDVRRATDALWQRYLGVKMLTDFTLRYSVRKPEDLPAPLATLYDSFPIVDA